MTILLIEDDAIEILKFNRSLIKLREVHELIEAHNGENALDILAENSQIDLILLDLNKCRQNTVATVVSKFIEQCNCTYGQA